jgi:hypothetical protein
MIKYNLPKDPTELEKTVWLIKQRIKDFLIKYPQYTHDYKTRDNN